MKSASLRLDTGNMVLSGKVMALRKVFIVPFISSRNGSFTGYFFEPPSTECSRMWKMPVSSRGVVLNAMENSLFSSPLSIHRSRAPVLSCSIVTSVAPISSTGWIFFTVNPWILSLIVMSRLPLIFHS